ncbi:MAG: 2-isopropylmalate synthase, partial [Gemmatimonadota bacterium]
ALPRYVETVSRATGVAIPTSYPVFGPDAFRTGTGVHAAAIIKARNKGDDWLADMVYSGVPAGMVGRKQVIEISHVSGMSNVKYWLREKGYNADDDELCKRVFELAKATDHTLTEDELRKCCEAMP